MNPNAVKHERVGKPDRAEKNTGLSCDVWNLEGGWQLEPEDGRVDPVGPMNLGVSFLDSVRR